MAKKKNNSTVTQVTFQYINNNQEIYNKFKSPHILTVNKVCRLEWCLRFVRKDSERMVKKLLEGKPEGGRKEGRPILRQVEDAELDLRNMGVDNGEQEFWTEQNEHLQ